jgi:SAM-dependent methyltransferase
MSLFANTQESHKHSLQTLMTLYEYDDFMESIRTVVDLGCGEGLDLEWWATATTRDENPQPLNIRCTGVDTLPSSGIFRKYPNATYQQMDFENEVHPPKDDKFDILWCHNSFQYAINPVQTLNNWWHMTSDGGMLILIVPQTTNIRQHTLAFIQESYEYHHYTLPNLIHMLALNGWDCKSGFFKKNAQDPWLYAIVYKSQHAPMNPKTTDWFTLSEKGLLPESAEKSVYAHSKLDQRDLVLPWIDQSLSCLGQQ